MPISQIKILQNISMTYSVCFALDKVIESKYLNMKYCKKKSNWIDMNYVMSLTEQ